MFPPDFKVGGKFELFWNRLPIRCADLDNHFDGFTLRAWCKNDHSVWDIWQRAKPMRLVFATNSNARIVHDFIIGHSNPNEIAGLCKHHMRARNNKTGDSFVDTHSNSYVRLSFDSWFYFQIVNKAFSYFMTIRRFRI